MIYQQNQTQKQNKTVTVNTPSIQNQKCCRKTCIYIVNSQVRQQLYQEYQRELNQSREHGRSYLRKYFYPYKNSERFSDGTPMNVMFQFRIPPKVPFDDRDKKIEICQRAFMKIFELRDIWAPWHVKREYGKWVNGRKSMPVTIFNFNTFLEVVYLVSSRVLFYVFIINDCIHYFLLKFSMSVVCLKCKFRLN